MLRHFSLRASPSFQFIIILTMVDRMRANQELSCFVPTLTKISLVSGLSSGTVARHVATKIYTNWNVCCTSSKFASHGESKYSLSTDSPGAKKGRGNFRREGGGAEGLEREFHISGNVFRNFLEEGSGSF